jgi:hypothetical protein
MRFIYLFIYLFILNSQLSSIIEVLFTLGPVAEVTPVIVKIQNTKNPSCLVV